MANSQNYKTLIIENLKNIAKIVLNGLLALKDLVVGIMTKSFREAQDQFILWCYHNYKKYPLLFTCMKHMVNISTYFGIYLMGMTAYRAFTFARKYSLEKTKQMLVLKNGLYSRYGGDQKFQSWAVITGGS